MARLVDGLLESISANVVRSRTFFSTMYELPYAEQALTLRTQGTDYHRQRACSATMRAKHSQAMSQHSPMRVINDVEYTILATIHRRRTLVQLVEQPVLPACA